MNTSYILYQGTLTDRIVYVNQVQEEYKNDCINHSFSRKRNFKSINTRYKNVYTVLMLAFFWSETPEKYDFWNKINTDISNILYILWKKHKVK